MYTQQLPEVNGFDVMMFEQGAGRAFSAGGDLKMFYEGRSGMRNYIAHK
jgi:enoyl-CoA hydratase/carnithine racemase